MNALERLVKRKEGNVCDFLDGIKADLAIECGEEHRGQIYDLVDSYKSDFIEDVDDTIEQAYDMGVKDGHQS